MRIVREMFKEISRDQATRYHGMGSLSVWPREFVAYYFLFRSSRRVKLSFHTAGSNPDGIWD
jgi:hypothetical protein